MVIPVDNKTKEPESYALLMDPCFGTGVVTTDVQCGTWQQVGNVTWFVADGIGNYVANAAGTGKTNGKPMRMTGSMFGDGVLGSTDVRTVAADAYFHIYWVFNYVFRRYKHLGLDLANGPQVHAMVRTNLTNSSIWDEKARAILVGSPNATYFDLASLDVIAHELGPAFNQFGPRLIYRGKTGPVESGNIAEATADMLAMLVSGYDGRDPVPHWIGEQTFRGNYRRRVRQSRPGVPLHG